MKRSWPDAWKGRQPCLDPGALPILLDRGQHHPASTLHKAGEANSFTKRLRRNGNYFERSHPPRPEFPPSAGIFVPGGEGPEKLRLDFVK